jgi:hypothetical protein
LFLKINNSTFNTINSTFNTQHSTLQNGNPNALLPFPRCGNGIDKPVQPDAGIKDGTL